MTSIIRDLALAPAGYDKINWVKAHMPILNTLEERFKADLPFAGKKVAICLHLEAKTAYMALVIQAGGAEVAVAGSNPLSTQDDVVAALVKEGITAFATHGCSPEEYKDYIQHLADFKPDLYIDDGGDFTQLLHEAYADGLKDIIGGCEETTTGIVRLNAMAAKGDLNIPMIAVNNAQMKHFFDNRYGTGESVWSAIMRSTNLVVAGTTCVVIGYGWCGKGVAMRAKGLGARVIVTEVDPIKAIEAMMDGFRVMPLVEAAPLGDVFITVTGNRHVIDREAMTALKDGAILCNAGHFDVEINKAALADLATDIRRVKPNIDAYTLADGRQVYLLAEGRLVNLAAGDGHPAEIMDLTFGLQVLSLKELVDKRPAAGLYQVPAAIDRQVATIKLKALGIAIDALTDDQAAYLNSWSLV